VRELGNSGGAIVHLAGVNLPPKSADFFLQFDGVLLTMPLSCESFDGHGAASQPISIRLTFSLRPLDFSCAENSFDQFSFFI
jgi:hypothetical protein